MDKYIDPLGAIHFKVPAKGRWVVLCQYQEAKNNLRWQNNPYMGVLFTSKYYALSVM